MLVNLTRARIALEATSDHESSVIAQEQLETPAITQALTALNEEAMVACSNAKAADGGGETEDALREARALHARARALAVIHRSKVD